MASAVHDLTPAEASADPEYGQTADKFLPPGALDGSPQPLLRSAGKSKPGGNRELYDVLYTVTATITNKGKIAGDEVPQLYVSLGGPNEPSSQARRFPQEQHLYLPDAEYRGRSGCL